MSVSAFVRRLFVGMTQETLANQLGLTFQQVQKWAQSGQRFALSVIAGILGVPISFFCDDLQRSDAATEERNAREQMERPETIELVRFYYAIPDQRVRKPFLETVKAVAASR
jgi:transcriptional regulator with XRE-family HTH domain